MIFMKKCLSKLEIILVVFLNIFALFLFSSCSYSPIMGNIENSEEVLPGEDNFIGFQYRVTVKGNPEIIKDCTPEIEIKTDNENIASMSFSGDGEDWSEWVPFAENYDRFNIASGLNGTKRESGFKTIFVRLKEKNGNILLEKPNLGCSCTVYYEMQPLFSIVIEPQEAIIKSGEKQTFILKGYDKFMLNEVPLDEKLAKWSKPCAVGELVPDVGLKIIYIPPQAPGLRNIGVRYGSLSAGAIVIVEG